jgi:hypothetical protein
MNRQIKFRGLRLDGKGWVVGSLLCPHAGNESTYIIGCNGSDFEVKPETVGQFTGLTDRNGVEVFEGDLVGIDGIVCPVKWMDGAFHIVMDERHERNQAIQVRMSKFEVIGNIHEQ